MKDLQINVNRPLPPLNSTLTTEFNEKSRTLDTIWDIENYLSHENCTFIESKEFHAPPPFESFKWKLKVNIWTWLK